MDFVMHVCKKCNGAFVAEDYTNAQDIPPHWRLCPDCCKAMGIDYEKQKPWNSYSEARKKAIEASKERLKKWQYKKKENEVLKN